MDRNGNTPQEIPNPPPSGAGLSLEEAQAMVTDAAHDAAAYLAAQIIAGQPQQGGDS
ncbi:hypothetical protein [Streptomyces gilvosporeus]|uniref:hypothetical protein n=1 Tax=Streptomyces gilvosporeus TaxID=553510 RepID=UPI0033D4A650